MIWLAPTERFAKCRHLNRRALQTDSSRKDVNASCSQSGIDRGYYPRTGDSHLEVPVLQCNSVALHGYTTLNEGTDNNRPERRNAICSSFWVLRKHDSPIAPTHVVRIMW